MKTGACPMHRSNFDVQSSDGAASYLVQTNFGDDFCNCPAYRYSGNRGEQSCKHIDAVYRYGCFGKSKDRLAEHDIKQLSSIGIAYGEDCLSCGAPMICTP
jgi:predicted nucleic acid-binding Zn finger protein